MKTEFLSSLGLEKDIIAKIMAENGKDVEAEKEKTNALKSEIETLKTSKTALESKVTELNKSASQNADFKLQFENLQKEIQDKAEKEKAEKEDAELTEAISKVFGDKKFSSEYVRRGIISDMKSEILKPENKGKGYAEIFENLTKDVEGIFANPNPPANMAGVGKIDTSALSDEQARKVMGLAPKNHN